MYKSLCNATSARRTFPTSLTGDVTSEITEDDWERGWACGYYADKLHWIKIFTTVQRYVQENEFGSFEVY